MRKKTFTIFLIFSLSSLSIATTLENREASNTAELFQKIPIITTNAHHHSVQYWLKKELISKNIKGLPILHFDSHTDMGHIPSHFIHEKIYHDTRSLLSELTISKINSFQRSLTDISQVIIPAIATGLSSEVHMCMPDWFTRFNEFDKRIPFSAVTLNKAQFVDAKTHKIFPITNRENNSLASPFYHREENIYKDDSMYFYKCFDDPVISLKSDYILSLDLDILSTNGFEHNHAMPTSTHRSKTSQISQKEMMAFTIRVQKIKNIILKLKSRGLSPKIITIAESTGSLGGDFTPHELATKANIELTHFFKIHFR